MRRVVITGIGAISPIGKTFGRSWESLCAGISGIRASKRLDTSSLPWKTTSEIKDFEPPEFMSGKEVRRLDLFVQYAAAAAVMAAEDAGLITSSPCITWNTPPASSGVIVGSSRGGISRLEEAIIRGSSDTHQKVSPFLMPSTTISMAASYVAQTLGIKGYCLGISNACSSGANAVGEAFRLIKSGWSDIVLAGGSEAPLCRVCLEGYGRSGALSREVPASTGPTPVPRPFDTKRDGFVLGEGACILALEDFDHAARRGARLYGEIIGYGNTTDAYHMTRPDPEGEAKAIRDALDEAGTHFNAVDYINTHGTATKIGDTTEAKAMHRVFGKRASVIPASAAKSMTGHMLAASGAFEIASTLMTLKHGVIPPTINLSEKDHDCDINIITDLRKAEVSVALSNSFGFGGVNAVIVLSSVS